LSCFATNLAKTGVLLHALLNSAADQARAMMGLDLSFACGGAVYDLLLACLFFAVVLSPFAIHFTLNVFERRALRRLAAQAQKKTPARAWVHEPAPSQTVTPATPSAR
jgi:hypothetical protein